MQVILDLQAKQEGISQSGAHDRVTRHEVDFFPIDFSFLSTRYITTNSYKQLVFDSSSTALEVATMAPGSLSSPPALTRS